MLCELRFQLSDDAATIHVLRKQAMLSEALDDQVLLSEATITALEGLVPGFHRAFARAHAAAVAEQVKADNARSPNVNAILQQIHKLTES